MTVTTPNEKREILHNLIDNMTACAIDRTSQSFAMFLDYRDQLFKFIEICAKEDEARIAFIVEMNERLQRECCIC